MNSKKSVEEFLSQNKIAVVGVSRKRNKFGNVIYRVLKKKGYLLKKATVRVRPGLIDTVSLVLSKPTGLVILYLNRAQAHVSDAVQHCPARSIRAPCARGSITTHWKSW